MNNITGFSYDSEEILKAIAKKHTESDVTIYGRKDQDLTTTIFSPLKFPDKISSLTDSVSLSDFNIVGMSHVDRFLGEVIIALDLLGKGRGFIPVKDDIDISSIQRITRGSVLSKYEHFNGSPMEMMGKIESMAKDLKRKEEGKVSVIIDHFFKVKSVGTVVLGFVESGVLKKHQNLYLNPTGKIGQVRSIQMNDIDFEEAWAGSRVGLALKNVEIDDMERGFKLQEDKIEPVKDISGKIVYHSAIGEDLKGDGEYFIAGNLRYQRGFLKDGILEMDRPAVKNESYLLVKPNSRPRIVGKIILSD